MSYQEQAEKLNIIFKQKLKGVLGQEAEAELIEAILRFGQVAKFRCRSNVAYDNFSKAVFEDIAKLERKQIEGLDFEALQVVKEEGESSLPEGMEYVQKLSTC